MNNDNEIIKEFNETFGNKPEVPVEPYKVVQNQSTDTQNVYNNMSVDANQNVNSTNITMPEFATQQAENNEAPEVNDTIINSNELNGNENINTEQNNVNINQQLYDTTNYINDAPVQKKTKKNTIKINPELKTIFLLAFVLLIAMSFVPTIFDFFDDLKIKFFS